MIFSRRWVDYTKDAGLSAPPGFTTVRLLVRRQFAPRDGAFPLSLPCDVKELLVVLRALGSLRLPDRMRVHFDSLINREPQLLPALAGCPFLSRGFLKHWRHTGWHNQLWARQSMYICLRTNIQ